MHETRIRHHRSLSGPVGRRLPEIPWRDISAPSFAAAAVAAAVNHAASDDIDREDLDEPMLQPSFG
jgi:hypothetical protein